MAYEHHPAAQRYPRCDRNELKALIASIRKQGQRHAIELCDGKILDGRNREEACKELGIEPKYVDVTAEASADPIAYVDAKNVHRRMLSKGQIAVVAVRTEFRDRDAWPKHGGSRTASDGDRHLTYAELASEYGTYKNAIKQAVALVRESDDDLAAAVFDGYAIDDAYKELMDRRREAKAAEEPTEDVTVALKAQVKEASIGVRAFAEDAEDEPATNEEDVEEAIQVGSRGGPWEFDFSSYEAFQSNVIWLANHKQTEDHRQVIMDAVKTTAVNAKRRSRKFGTQMTVDDVVLEVVPA